MPKVVCTALTSKSGPHIGMLSEAGFEVGFVPPHLHPYKADELISILSDADAVVAGSEPYPRKVIEALPKLRVIARSGVGFDAIDLAACDDRNIPVCTTPGCNHHSVAEHCIALLMAVARGFPGLDQQVRAKQWKLVAFPRVMGRTISILGLGRIGQAVATRAIGLGMHVVAYDPMPYHEFAREWSVELVDFETAVRRADFLSLHLPCTAETRNVMNAAMFAKMRRGSILINTARGGLVNETDLCDALRSGQLAGAGLDVFQVEPLPLDSPLLQFENVLVSGHIAGLDQESAFDTAKMYAEIIIGLYHGRWPDGCVQNLRGVKDWKW